VHEIAARELDAGRQARDGAPAVRDVLGGDREGLIERLARSITTSEVMSLVIEAIGIATSERRAYSTEDPVASHTSAALERNAGSLAAVRSSFTRSACPWFWATAAPAASGHTSARSHARRPRCFIDQLPP